jgi:hypothetical protein
MSRFISLLGMVIASILLVGCVSRGPETVEINIIGQPPSRVLAAIVAMESQSAIEFKPIATQGVIVGFNGLITKFLENYAGDLLNRYASGMKLIMAKDDLPLVADDFWISQRENQEVVVMGFSNNDSFFGLGGRNAFLKKLEKLGVTVDLLVLFDDVWEGEIPANVEGVINIYTGNLITGRAVTTERLRGQETWVVNVFFSRLDHSRLPLCEGGVKSAYEEFTRKYYTTLILAALEPE